MAAGWARGGADGSVGAEPCQSGTNLRLPGINNWELTAHKNFRFKERFNPELRAQFYNAFNHTHYSNVDTTARFDAHGLQVNTQFGRLTFQRSAAGGGQFVVEVIEVLAACLDADGHGAGESGEVACAGVRHDGDGELLGAAGHGAGMLQGKGPLTSAERAGNALDGDVAGRTFDGSHGCEHFTLAHGFQIAVELFVERHAAERGAFGHGVRRLGRELYIEGSGGSGGHGPSIMRERGRRIARDQTEQRLCLSRTTCRRDEGLRQVNKRSSELWLRGLSCSDYVLGVCMWPSPHTHTT